MLKQVEKIIKDNQNKLIQLGLADEIEFIDYELKYNPYTRRDTIVFYSMSNNHLFFLTPRT